MHMIYESASAEQNRTYRWPSATAVALLRPAAARPRALASATAALALGLGVLVQLLHAQVMRGHAMHALGVGLAPHALRRLSVRARRAGGSGSPEGRAGPAPL